jgi:hypothetical protein
MTGDDLTADFSFLGFSRLDRLQFRLASSLVSVPGRLGYSYRSRNQADHAGEYSFTITSPLWKEATLLLTTDY